MAISTTEVRKFRQTNPHSMTGFGRSTITTERATVSVEVKSLNCKFLEIRPKVPRIFSAWEPSLRSTISQNLKRGTVEVLVGYQILDAALINPINETALKAYAKGIASVSERLNIPSGLDLTSLLRLPGALSGEDLTGLADSERSEFFQMLDRALAEALQELLVMRSNEGKALLTVLEREANVVVQLTKKIRKLVPEVNEKLRQRISERMQNTLQGVSVKMDESRFLQELAYYCDRSDVTEELDRLESHSNQFLSILSSEKNLVVGKRLDFLIQEMLRETNTIGSKSDGIDLTNFVVELKLAIDRLREQIQNLE